MRRIMFNLEVVRSYLPAATVGYIIVDGRKLQTLERPWRLNEANISCIPEGTYLVKRDRSGRWQYYSITNVPNRTFIEIHPANNVEQLAGCLALGVNRMRDSVSVSSSEVAIDLLMDYVGDNDFTITFRSYNPNTDGILL